MADDGSRDWLFCNYCGEALDIGTAYNHVSKNHGDKIRSDPANYDPKKRGRVLAIQVACTLLLMILLIVVLVGLGEDMNGEIALMLIVSYGAGLVLLFGVGEHIVRKGEKPAKETIDDLLVKCQICDAKVPWRDQSLHDDLAHPGEQEAVKRVYTPVAIIVLGILGIGFVGGYLTVFLGESDLIEESAAILMSFVFLSCVVIGLALGVLFELQYHRPRMERLGREWRRLHGLDVENKSNEKR